MSKFIPTEATPDSLMDYVQDMPVDRQVYIVARFIRNNSIDVWEKFFDHPRFMLWVTRNAREIITLTNPPGTQEANHDDQGQ